MRDGVGWGILKMLLASVGLIAQTEQHNNQTTTITAHTSRRGAHLRSLRIGCFMILDASAQILEMRDGSGEPLPVMAVENRFQSESCPRVRLRRNSHLPFSLGEACSGAMKTPMRGDWMNRQPATFLELVSG